MHSNKNTYRETLQLIADILSFQNPIEDLKHKLSSTVINWEQFVTVSSDHLVLTTCYCRLKQKDLLKSIPQDLESYLEEITAINRNRNLSLLKQINHIATIFNDNNIDYTFLKGTALLVGNYFEDIGERMIGDIDVLVNENQILEVFNLLLEQTYESMEQTLGSKYFEQRHLPALISKNYIAAIEIHERVLEKPHKKTLLTFDILNDKQQINKINIPSNKHLILHSILNWQINDFGKYYIALNLKSSYDAIVSLRRDPSFTESLFNLSYIKSYMSIVKLFFSDFNQFKCNKITSNLFLLKLKSPLFKRILDVLLKKLFFIKRIFIRLIFSIHNKNYRKDLFKDYRRIFSLIKSKF